MPVQQVGQLLQRWQSATGVVSQGRVIADGMRLLAGLTPDERRTVARALSEEGAPALAQRLSAASGDRIDASTAHDAARGLLALDREQIAHLADVLSDPDERLRLAQDAASVGLDALDADADGPPPAPGAPPPPSPGSQLLGLAPPMSDPTTASYPTESLHAIANGEIPLGDAELGHQVLDHPGLGEIHLADTDLHEIALIADTPSADARSDASAAPASDDAATDPNDHAAGATHLEDVHVDDGSVPGIAAVGAAVAGVALTDAHASDPHADAAEASDADTAYAHTDAPGASDAHTANAHTHAAGASDTHIADAHTADALSPETNIAEASAVEGGAPLSSAPDGSTLGVPALAGTTAPAATAGDDGAALVRALRQARTAHERFTAVADHDLAALRTAAALQVLDAVPEGWQRRRVAARLTESGALGGVSARELLRRFPGRSDAAFVAGVAIAQGTFRIDELSGHVPERVIHRLRVRTGGG